MGIKIKLVKSSSSSSERQLATIRGLGLSRFGSEKLVQDTKAVRGMLAKVRHLVSMETVKDEPKTRVRRKPKHIRARDASRAAAAQAK